MSLRVRCGPFTPALERAFLARLKELAPGPGRPVAIVAPSRRLADRLERLIAAEAGLAVLGCRVHTFYSLALEALEALGGPSGRLAGGGLFHDLILDRLLEATGARPSRGLAAAYRASLRDLIDGGVEPAQFAEHLRGLITDPAAQRRLQGLFGLLARYRRKLAEAGVLAPSGLAREAAEAVASGRAAGLERYREILYYGFYDLTGSQADLFDAVTGAFPCTLFFPYRKGRAGLQFAKRFLEVRLGKASIEYLEEEEDEVALGATVDALFAPLATASPKPGALRIFSASGARDEVWTVAKEILALREGPRPPAFSDIGVVARTLEPYRAAVADVFQDNAIPFWLGSSGPLLRLPAAKRALNLLLLRRREFPARLVLDIARSPRFNSARFHAPAAPLQADWKRLIDRLGLHSGWLQWEGRLEPWTKDDLPLGADPEGPCVPRAHAALLLRWLRSLHEALAGPASAGRGDWPAMAAHARRVLEENFDEPEAGDDTEAWRATLDAVDALAGFGAAAPDAGFEEFLDALEESLRRAEAPSPPANQGVRVLDAMDARGDSFKHLFLIGLQEKIFPRQVREDALLPDAVRARLENPGGYWILPKLEGYGEERLLFTLLAGAATETLRCVYPRSSEDGRAQVPSIYLRELCRAAGTDLEAATRVPRRPFEKLAFAGARRLSPKEAAALAVRGGRSGRALLEPLGLDGGLLDDCRARLPELSRPGEPGPMDGIVGPPVEWLKRSRARGLSPTALEQFVSCPFQFFASRLLGLGEPEEPSERGELSPRSRGELAHKALERFHRALAAKHFFRGPTGAWEPALESAMAEALDATGWRALGVYPVVWEAARRRLESRLRALAGMDVERIRATGLVPRLFERELSAEVAGIALHGRADRIDQAEGGAVWVVDYKSGRGPAKLRDALKRMDSLQPALYLELALAEGLGTEEAAAGAALYCLEGTPQDASAPAIVALTRDDWRAARKRLLENLREHVARMGRGEFFISKEDGPAGVCRRCSFGAVCRKSHGATWRRAEGSRLMKSFKSACEI